MLRVNDTPLEFEDGMTVRDILRRRNYVWRMIAVYVNGELVPRGAYDTRQVPDGAEVKVIHQIAGG
jgi:sulfur carrier protein